MKANPISVELREIEALTLRLIDQRNELMDNLKASVELIRNWHGMGLPKEIEPDTWRLYWENSPEMKPIRELLEKHKD